MTGTDELLLEIARCPIAQRCLDGDFGHPCSTVVHAQHVDRDGFHVPEPWNGAIDTAPILFVSWNPSFNPNERFPTPGWADADIVEFFRKRFEHTNQNSQTWKEIRTIATRLLRRTPQPGLDYAVTDIVRCKSTKGLGAREALNDCSGRYLRRTLGLSPARVVVALGRDARRSLAAHFGVPTQLGAYPIAENGRQRVVALLGAPGSSEPRHLDADALGLAHRALGRQ